jgi:hypothetical protein
VRNGDPARQSGRGLCLTRHRRGDQAIGIGGAAGSHQQPCDAGDDCLLVGARIGVEQDEIGRDDRR